MWSSTQKSQKTNSPQRINRESIGSVHQHTVGANEPPESASHTFHWTRCAGPSSRVAVLWGQTAYFMYWVCQKLHTGWPRTGEKHESLPQQLYTLLCGFKPGCRTVPSEPCRHSYVIFLLLRGQAERVGAVQPGEDKAAGRPYSSLPVPEGGL